MGVRVQTIGLKETLARLDSMRRCIGRTGQVYPEISNIVIQSIQSNFQAGGRDPKWPPRKREYSWPILNKTGEMKDRSVQEAKEWVHWRGKQSISHIKITSTHYAKYHQYGTSRLPERKFVKLLLAEIEQIWAILRKIFA